MTPAAGGFAALRALVAWTVARGGRGIISLVGAGGKTTALFALARSLSAEGCAVLATTTTHILDPGAASAREGRGFGPVVVHPDPSSPECLDALAATGPRAVLAAGREGSRLTGIDPAAVPAVAALYDVVLIEADGARRRSIKAPAAHEPEAPASSSIVIGCVGLDALGAAMDERTVHRPELFGPLTGCAPGEAISAEHVGRLAASPDGLFKTVLDGCLRVVLLNKADTVPRDLAEECARAVTEAGGCDAVFICGVEREAGS
jgi:probable selenium-dependent hydroxylase accessory protein YqeC